MNKLLVEALLLTNLHLKKKKRQHFSCSSSLGSKARFFAISVSVGPKPPLPFSLQAPLLKEKKAHIHHWVW